MDADHVDPWSEASQRVLERLMALGVLAEAGSRLAAERARRSDTAAGHAAAQAARLAEADRTARRNADRHRVDAAHRRREVWSALGSDPARLRQHLAGLPLQELARQWGQAIGDAAHDPAAATVSSAAEQELRVRWPALIDQYRQLRDDGIPAE